MYGRNLERNSKKQSKVDFWLLSSRTGEEVRKTFAYYRRIIKYAQMFFHLQYEFYVSTLYFILLGMWRMSLLVLLVTASFFFFFFKPLNLYWDLQSRSICLQIALLVKLWSDLVHLHGAISWSFLQLLPRHWGALGEECELSSCGEVECVVHEQPGSTRDLPWVPWFLLRCFPALEGSCCICGSEHCCSHIILLIFCGDIHHDS